MPEREREREYRRWRKAVERSFGWHEEDEPEPQA
jgi:glycerol kinase